MGRQQGMRTGTITRATETALCLFLALLALGCRGPGKSGADPWSKVTFDVSELDDDGLRGPPDGHRAVSYEFCIPDTPDHEAEVSGIDPTVECTSRSPGRIGCGEDEMLCIGSTHQESFRAVLRQLAALDYVERIDEAHFE